jgi:hypothetical protein
MNIIECNDDLDELKQANMTEIDLNNNQSISRFVNQKQTDIKSLLS